MLAGDRLIGIFSERDILKKVVVAGRDPRHNGSRGDGARSSHRRAETSLTDALSLMTDGHFRHLPVVDGEGHVIAMLSIRDIPSEHQITYHQSKVAQARRGSMATTRFKSSFRRLVRS